MHNGYFNVLDCQNTLFLIRVDKKRITVVKGNLKFQLVMK